MAHRSYLRIWTRHFSEATIMPAFARLLTSLPLSTARSVVNELRIRGVEATEVPVAEGDLRDQGYGPPEIGALAVQHLNPDTAYFVGANWDIWLFDMETMKWRQEPQPLVLVCHGPLYDDGVAAIVQRTVADEH